MQELIISLMEKYGYLGILFLIAIENIFPPIPSEVILTFGGFLTTTTELTIIGVIFFSTLGSLIGAVLLYFIGRKFNREKLLELVCSKIGKALRFKKQHVNKTLSWFDDKGQKTVFLCRFVPILRSLISIPAGMCGMRFSKFMIYSLGGTVIWNSVLIILGYFVGDNWGKIVSVMSIYSRGIALLIVLFIIGMFLYTRRKRRGRK